MTVAEMIAALQRQDPQDEVRIEQDWGYEEITEIRRATNGRGVALLLEGDTVFLCPSCGKLSDGRSTEGARVIGVTP